MARNDLLPGTLDMMVLKALTTGPLHGYALAQQIQRWSGDVLRVEEGALYPALYRMEERGWVAASWKATETGRQARVYRLRRAGRARLRAAAEEWHKLSSAVSRVLAWEV